MNFDLAKTMTMSKEQKMQALQDCLNIAASLSNQLDFRFEDLFETMFDELADAE
jgi:hypothetical protein